LVGGGNTAIEEALFLANFTAKVTVIHRRNTFRAEKILQERLFKNPKINVVWNSTVEEIIGDDSGVTGIKIRNVKTKQIKEIKTYGVFIAIGHNPASEIFKGQVEIDGDGYIVTKPDSTITNIPGVFAAGDVRDRHFRQAVTAAGMGCMAALEADKHLAEIEDGKQKKTA
ncbi:MAG: FAD-dependent oxidoreductase, partial [Alphaproteobacteria bacterium]|nr:FAD-dependent oxidoreductase [Alphaproteobacteria bacterium]